MDIDDDNTPRKRKSRHSINVFQSGSKKPPTSEDEEQPTKIKKRKSMAASLHTPKQQPQSESHTPQSQPKSQSPVKSHQPAQPIQHHQPIVHAQPQPQVQTTPQVHHQPIVHPQPQPTPQPQPRPQYVYKPQYVQPRDPPIQPQPHLPPAPHIKKPAYVSYPSYSRPGSQPQSHPQPQPQHQPQPQPQPKAYPAAQQAADDPFNSRLPPPPSPAPSRTVPASPLPPPPPPLTPSTLSRFSAPKTVPSPPKTTSSPPKAKSTKPPREARSSRRTFVQYLYVLVMLVLWCLALLSVITAVFKHVGTAVRFCDSDGEPSTLCIPCPPNGVCSGGVLQCNPKFVRYGMNCIEDLELNLMADDMAEKIYEKLMLAAGDCKCGKTPHNYVTLGELKEDLNNTGIYPQSKFDAAFVEALTKMTTDPRYEFSSEGDQFSTKHAKFTLACMVKLLILQQVPYMIILAAGVLLCFAIVRWRRNAAKQLIEVNNIVALVLLDLQVKKESSNGGDSGIVVDHLRDKLLHGRERHKANVWRRVVGIVQADSRVNEYASFKNGAQVTNWEWVGDIAR